jgi:hypothetical protein
MAAAAASLGDEAKRQPHQGAERRLDGAEVDRGARQEEHQQRNHQRSVSASRRPPFRLSRRSRRAI